MGFSSPAILLKRIDFGDHDLIISFLSLNRGKVSVIAKNAKKSRKRFSGLLEPFTELDIVVRAGRNNSMPVLQEASMLAPAAGICGNLVETAYASYWAELILGWIEAFQPQPELYTLLVYSLTRLADRLASPHVMSIVFQVRFLRLAGLAPHLESCVDCGVPLDRLQASGVFFDLAKGGIVCHGCSAGSSRYRTSITKGTAKLLSWIQSCDTDAAMRLRFDERSMKEATRILEAFVPHHLGRVPKSLKFLKDLR